MLIFKIFYCLQSVNRINLLFFLYLFHIWAQCIKFSISILFSGLVCVSVVLSPSCSPQFHCPYLLPSSQFLLQYYIIYIYNSICARRHKHINFSASAQLNASQIAVMEGSHWRIWMVGPEILFLINQCCFLAFFCTKWLHKACSNPTNLTSARLHRSADGTGGGPTWRVQWT